MTDHDPTRRQFLGLTGAAGASAVLGGLLLPEPARADPSGPPAEFRWNPRWETRAAGHVLVWDAGESWCFPAGLPGDDRWYIRCGKVWYDGIFLGSEQAAKRVTELFTAQTLRAAVVAVDKVAFALPGRPAEMRL